MNAAFRRFLPVAASTVPSDASASLPVSIAAACIAAITLVASISTDRSNHTSTQCQESRKRPKLVFLGTGSSTGCPKPLCAMLFPQQHSDNHTNNNGQQKQQQQQQQHPTPTLSKAKREFRNLCQVSNLAIQGDPKHNKDYRNNPSLLISHYQTSHGSSSSSSSSPAASVPTQDATVQAAKNVVIDVGKTFREGALRWFPEHDIQSLDAVILTHHHMDAVAGLDDLRGFQRFRGLDRTEPPTRIPIQVFLSHECFEQVSSQFPWLFPKTTPAAADAAAADDAVSTPVVKRDVAALDVQLVQNYQPFDAAGLEIVPLPVWHGSDLISLGFSFSIRGGGDDKIDGNARRGEYTNVVYISDISQMVPETMDYIRTKLPQTDILIVDCLLPEFQHPVHFNLTQAVDLSKEIKAKQTFLVGMSCDAFPSHDVVNEWLAKEYGKAIQFAHDGQVLYL